MIKCGLRRTPLKDSVNMMATCYSDDNANQQNFVSSTTDNGAKDQTSSCDNSSNAELKLDVEDNVCSYEVEDQAGNCDDIQNANTSGELKPDQKDDSGADLTAQQHAEVNVSQVQMADRIKSPAVAQIKMNARLSSPGTAVKDEVRSSVDPQKVKEREDRLRMARERREEAQKRRLEELQEALARHQESRKKQEDERRKKIEEMKRREEEHRSVVEERRKKLIDDENMMLGDVDNVYRANLLRSDVFGGPINPSSGIKVFDFEERRQAILRRNAEREARLELLKPVKHTPGVSSLGGHMLFRCSPNLANSAPVPGKPFFRPAVSVRDVSLVSNDPLSSRSAGLGQGANSVGKQRLSMSTSHLSIVVSQTLNSSPKSIGNQPDGAVSTDNIVADQQGQQRRSRHRSLVANGRSPGYASDTVSSMQLKASHSGTVGKQCCSGVVCSRYRSVSPGGKRRGISSGPAVRSSRTDAVKVGDRRAKDDTNKDAVVVEEKSQKLARFKSMPSKLNSDSKISCTTTPKPLASKEPSMTPRARTQSLKRINQSPSVSVDKTPIMARSMPTPPKAMAPRSVPREPRVLKEVMTLSNSTSTPGKGIMKALHHSDQKAPKDKKKEAVIQLSTDKSAEKSANANESARSVQEDKEGSKDTGQDANVKPIETEVRVDKEVTEPDAPSSDKAEVVKKPANGPDDDYKAKLAEKRRLAREKAEREAAEEKQRQEDQKRLEEEQRQKEEEEQHQREEEELRLAAEARRLEEERFLRAVEEADRQRKEEEERLEAERQEKLESESRAQAEAEKKEKERLEKLKREEEERLERKKKLEMIMKRVKTDDSSLQKELQPSPVGSVSDGLNNLASSESSLNSVESSRLSALPAVSPATDNGVSKFRSPLLRQMMEGKLSKAGGNRTEPAAENSTSKSSIASANNEQNGADGKVISPVQSDVDLLADDCITMSMDTKPLSDDDKDIDESEVLSSGSPSNDSERYNSFNVDPSVLDFSTNVSPKGSVWIAPEALIHNSDDGIGVTGNGFDEKPSFEQVIDLSLTDPSSVLQLSNCHDSRPPPVAPLIAFD